MKVIIFLDYYDERKILGAATTAYSIKINGGLPENTKYILYSWSHELIQENMLAKCFFDEIAEPPVGKFWDSVPDWHPHRSNDFGIATWTKLLSWINTPCDGEPVAVVDYDILCIGSIREAIPTGQKLFSGRRRREYSGVLAEGCNGGFYVKAPDFDTSEIPQMLQAPLFDKEAFEQASSVWREDCTDELGTIWYFKQRGYGRFLELPPKFNYVTRWLVDGKQDVYEKNVRMLHFMGKYKPWMKVPDEYAPFKNIWEIYERKVIEEPVLRAIEEKRKNMKKQPKSTR